MARRTMICDGSGSTLSVTTKLF